MQIHFRTQHMDVTDDQKRYIEEKLMVLEKYSERIASDEAAQIWVNVERNESLDSKRKVIMRVSMAVPKAVFRAEINALTIEEATDMIHDKLLKQVERYKTKHMHTTEVDEARMAQLMSGTESVTDENGRDLRVSKRKLFSDLVPMTESEAINQMHALGHTFFIFVNVLTDRYNIVYLRPDKTSYGLIELEHKDGVIGN